MSGATYVLREWGGLWPPGERGFVVGDRRLMLLHRAGPTGLSSPVGGFEGAIPVVGTGARVGSGSRAITAAEPMLDLRWITAKLARPGMGVGGGVLGTPTVGGMGAERTLVEAGGGEPERALVVTSAERAPTLVHGTLPGRPGGGGLGSAGLAVSVSEPMSAGTESALPLTTVVGLLRQWQGSESVAR